MRRLLSFVLSALLIVSVLSVSCVSAYSADKITAEEKLVQIQTQKGFIPGQTAAVTGNCYGFVSKVCEKLYGVGYNGEQLYNSYQCKHSTGNYYTVSTYTTTETTPTATVVSDIMNFFLSYAMSGDIVHYGGLSSSGTHTIMIQSIDSEKLCFYHSNYETNTYSRESCHIDTIYWDSFKSSPTKNVNTSKGYSMNALFYNKMKSTGLGITINRYSKYTSLYSVVNVLPVIKASRAATNAIKLTWNTVREATKYRIQYKLSAESSYKTASSNCTALTYTVKNLVVGENYDFRVCAYSSGKWQSYSDVITISVMPPTISAVTFENDPWGIRMTWGGRADIDGVRIYRSQSQKGEYTLVCDLDEENISTYLDDSVVGSKTYYYKFERYVVIDDIEYKTTSAPKQIYCTKVVLKKPVNVTASNYSLTSIKVTWDKVTNADYYILEYKEKGGSWKKCGKTTNLYKRALSLTPDKKYYFRVTAGNGIVDSPVSDTVSKTAVVPKPAKPSVKKISSGFKVSWKKVNDATGYKVYRSYSKNSGYKLIKTVGKGSTLTFSDKKVKKGKSCYYKIVATTKYDGKTYSSAMSTERYAK